MSRHARKRRTFYAALGGKRYHRDSTCQALDRAREKYEVRSMSRHDVLAAELGPCMNCSPPIVSLTVVHGVASRT